MGEGIGPHYGLIRLHGKPCDAGYQARGSYYVFGVDAGFHRKKILARAHGHDNFFQCRIARSLAQAIDRALHLAHAVHYRT